MFIIFPFHFFDRRSIFFMYQYHWRDLEPSSKHKTKLKVKKHRQSRKKDSRRKSFAGTRDFCWWFIWINSGSIRQYGIDLGSIRRYEIDLGSIRDKYKDKCKAFWLDRSGSIWIDPDRSRSIFFLDRSIINVIQVACVDTNLPKLSKI